MIKKITLNVASLDQFIAQLKKELIGRELGNILDFSIENENLKIIFSKMGKSEILFSTQKIENGFLLLHFSEKIALLHKPLKNDIESKLCHVLQKMGAEVETV
jgi:hypothetical protein